MNYKNKERREKEIKRLEWQLANYDDIDSLNFHWWRSLWFIEWKIYILENMED